MQSRGILAKHFFFVRVHLSPDKYDRDKSNGVVDATARDY